MSDLISRQAAIEVLHMDTSIIPYKKAREYVDATILEIRNRLENLPSAHPVQRWIPCNERLPEESGNYLVTAMWKGRPEVDMDYWQFDCMWDDWGDEVIAWMPLPEPWKGGEDETD